MRRRFPIRCAVLVLAATLVGGLPATAKAKKHPQRTAAEWVEILEDPSREAWQRPLDVLQVLGVEAGDLVADLGAGSGYFTELLAIQVRESGRVTAVDVDPELLDYIRGRDDLPAGRVETLLAAPDDPKLEPASQDLILIVDTWHHIRKRSRYIPKLERALRPGGRVAIVDYRAGELPVGPPESRRLPRERVLAEFRRAGWSLVAESVALPYQYMLIFSPAGSVRPGFLDVAGEIE